MTGNPLLVTYARLARRARVWPAVALSLLMSGLLLFGLTTKLGRGNEFSLRQAGLVWYSWLLAVEGLVLLYGISQRITRALIDERQKGLLESNWLSPLAPHQLALGYWLGPALREAAMAGVFLVSGLPMILYAGLPFLFWCETQALLLSTALLLSLLALVVGTALPKPQSGTGIGLLAVASLFSPLARTAGSAVYLPSLLVPFRVIVSRFGTTGGGEPLAPIAWMGLDVPAVLLAFVAQAALGAFLWIGAVRKLGDPHVTLLSRAQSLGLYGLLLLLQHGLLWPVWRGSFTGMYAGTLGTVHAGALGVGLLLLTGQCARPEQLRLLAIRHPDSARTRVLLGTGPAFAVALAALAAAGLLLHFVHTIGDHLEPYGIAAANLLFVFTLFAFLFEWLRARLSRGLMSVLVLIAFVLCVAPMLASSIASEPTWAAYSLLAPGPTALAGPDPAMARALRYATAVHGLLTVGLGLLWWSGCRSRLDGAK